MDDIKLEWSKPMTSNQAAGYHLTSGFVAYELYDQLRRRNAELEARCGDLQEECDRIKEENGNMDSMYQDRLLDMEAKVNKAVSECDRLQEENERLLRCLADYPAGNQTEPDVKAALREVDGGK